MTLSSNLLKIGLANMPPHIRVGTAELDCTDEPATFAPDIVAAPSESMLLLTLVRKGSEVALRQWRLKPQPISLRYAAGAFALKALDDASVITPVSAKSDAVDPALPYCLKLQAVNADDRHIPAVWLPVYAHEMARQQWTEAKNHMRASAAGRFLPPCLAPGSGTLRVVARNIMSRDAVGNFSISLAATLLNYGMSARAYAYASCPELAGLVSPPAELAGELRPEDVLFYNYSTEDEFLPLITRLPCKKKILYYHNVTPGHWFQGKYPEVAAALERARRQYSLFSAFDAVIANSSFSLQDLLPHVAKDTPKAVYPPSLAPDRLLTIRPQTPSQTPPHNYLLWVGRNVPHKRPEAALDIFSRLSTHTDALALVMVLGGRRDFPLYAADFEAKMAAFPAPVRNRIIIYEDLNEAQLAWLYRHALLLLCTSQHEGYCLPVREAMSFGLPIAAFAQAAVEETLNGYGHILPERPEEAAKALWQLLKDAQ
ncbi:glycosyltransferase [Desulfovibrio sp. OttesenSCG-928-M14]|nr:glycosyltransferase [Desulfovibrio sp. OttesenSCG-928-M14]